MKSTVGIALLILALVFAFNSPKASATSATSATSAPLAAPSGAWTTGAVGTLGDVVYAAGGDYVIDLAVEGEYDPVLWVVILDYNTLTIEAGATVRFANHASRAPVVIRALGPIVIAGKMKLNGADGHTGTETQTFAEPGPGGFRGGIGGSWWNNSIGSDGFGPGGGRRTLVGSYSASASHATLGSSSSIFAQPGALYGSALAVPLVGGSGGTLTFGAIGGNAGGGGGGGALLLGSDTSIDITGRIKARGGHSGLFVQNGDDTEVPARAAGSGGMIRVASPTVTWQGSGGSIKLGAMGGKVQGGDGWVRVETDGKPADGPIPSLPPAIHSTTLGEFLPRTLPTVTLSDVLNGATGQWEPIGQDPRGVLDDPLNSDIQLDVGGFRTFRIEGRNVPLGSPLHVRVTYANGLASTDNSLAMGTLGGSTFALSWTAVTVDFTVGAGTIQIRTELP